MKKNSVHILLSKKAKQPFIKDGILYYASKLRPYANLKIIESKNEKTFERHCQKLEKETITVVLDQRGRQLTTESFSKYWLSLTHQGAKGISFIVGGPHGFSHTPRTDIAFSLSSLTYNHELVPLVLMEQIYRAYTLLKGHPYHHG